MTSCPAFSLVTRCCCVRTQPRLAVNMGLLTSYYTWGTPSFLFIVIALYLLFTGMSRNLVPSANHA